MFLGHRVLRRRTGLGGRGTRVRRFTIAAVGKIAPERARARALAIAGSVAEGIDPANEKTVAYKTLTVSELADQFMSLHVRQKRKPSTAKFYRDILERIVRPALGVTKVDRLTRQQVSKLHSDLHKTPFQANRVLAVIGSMYGFAARSGIVEELFNPVRNVEKFKEGRRERFLTSEEIQRLGKTIRIAETTGLPWTVETNKPSAKHLPKPANRFSRINPFAAAAIRLLMFTGCRLREVLNLRWENVDLERGLLFLPDSKTGRKTIVLNAPARHILANLTRLGPYVIPGDDPQLPRFDLKAPWAAITKHAKLGALRLHDLRHTFASIGAGGGLGLPIIGRLLGHAHATTTARYAHLDNDPLRIASEAIGRRIAAALAGRASASIVSLEEYKRK